MKISEKAKSASELIKQSNETANLNKTYDEYRRTKEKFNEIYKTFSNYYKSIKVLNRENSDIFAFDDLSSLKNKIERIQKDINNECFEHSNMDYIFTNIKDLEGDLKSKANEYIHDETHALVDTLESIKSIINERDEVEQIIRVIKNNRVMWPFDEERLSIIKGKEFEGKKIISSLGLNPSIEKFIEKIVNSKATLLDLTPEILEWIKEKDFQEKICLKFTNS